jgi:hypothetical protein
MFTVLEPIQEQAKYIAELFVETEWDPRLAIPDDVIAGHGNMSAFSVAPLITDPSNYWIAWGGFFDNYVGLGIQIFLNQFLETVVDLNSCINTANSFYIDEATNMVYMNTTYAPWLYLSLNAALSINEMSTFSSAPKDENNLSDIFYGVVQALPRLRPPSIQNKLSDAISGLVLYNSFTFDVDNTDGLFDAMDIIEYFNTPTQVRKTTEAADSLINFNIIRKGLVTDIDVSADSMRVTGVDVVYRMEQQVCRRVSTEEFPLATENIDKQIPIGWGNFTGKDLLKLWDDAGTNYYITLDKNFITSVSACYDSDGVSRAFNFDSGTGIIDSTFDLSTADFVGRTDSRIAVVIKELLEEYENIPFTAGLWDIVETERYIDISPEVNLYADSGKVKDVIQAALKNDIAFLIQKNNGLLSLRRWGLEYEVWQIDNWLLTQRPEKNFENASRYYCSSVQVDYSGGQVLDDSRESELFSQFRRSFTANLVTVLEDETEAEDLAARFLDRFGDVRETIKAGYGVDTYQVNLLDTIITEINFNDRQFSEYSEFIVIEADPAQDKVVLEGTKITNILTFDGNDATLDNNLWSVDA